jgi:O-succinylbenzoate synthase
MAIERIEIDLVRLPYVHFFETSFGRSYDRTFSLIKVCEGGVCGWGECVAEEAPLYSGETTETAWHVMKEFLVPLIFRKGVVEPEDFAREASVFRGNPMAKAGIELALWDLKAKKMGVPLRGLYGGTRTEIEAGVSCGIEDSLPDLVARVGEYLGQGYKRIKIKIKPGWDVAACAAVREAYPDITLQADANGAYKLKDTEILKALDAFGLAMIEQPFAPYDLWDHAKLQREVRTPLCLDESVLSVDTARAALEMGSCRIVNIKVGRVGGVVETRRTHNLHIASLPGFKLPNDLSASRRYYKEDVIEPFIELSGPGTIRVPDGPGIGVNPVESRIALASVRREIFK